MEIDAADVLQRYTDFLSQNRTGVIRDASFLPYPKDVIKAVLLGMIDRLAPDDAQSRAAVMIAYIRLCDYPKNLSDDERSAADIMRQIFAGRTAQESNAARGELTLEVGKIYERLMQRQAAERDQLTNEMRRHPGGG